MNKEILIGTKLLHHSEIERITTDIAIKLDAKFASHKTLPVVIGVLKGAAPFMFDIVRKMKTIVNLDFIDVSSYRGTQSTGQIRMNLAPTENVTGRDVIVIDDVIETGLTSYYLNKYLLEEKRVNSITNVFLVDKTLHRKYAVNVDFAGLVYDKEKFLIGYGLDYNGLLRNILAVYELEPEDISKLDSITDEDCLLASRQMNNQIIRHNPN